MYDTLPSLLHFLLNPNDSDNQLSDIEKQNNDNEQHKNNDNCDTKSDNNSNEEIHSVGGLLPSDIAVVACHACSHLSDSILDFSFDFGVEVAIMACCHKDGVKLPSKNQYRVAAKYLGLPLGAVKDVATLGKILQAGYECRWRTIDEKITPQNRILVALKPKDGSAKQQLAHQQQSTQRLTNAYMAAHKKQDHSSTANRNGKTDEEANDNVT
eukprot:CAMPEP_0174258790 /NCGR_PEP_ID=MMETSP0439-20130205/7733_1 /TAXON_ID=0 /ORGANISM="Stereomyxa ramosa, Strain Chinc5" /LENGTH=211 /DNA_ID=CAMNT_0015342429 /DNA_START=223 /DNA_END=859 /DNA_ORIENTATION=-